MLGTSVIKNHKILITQNTARWYKNSALRFYGLLFTGNVIELRQDIPRCVHELRPSFKTWIFGI